MIKNIINTQKIGKIWQGIVSACLAVFIMAANVMPQFANASVVPAFVTPQVVGLSSSALQRQINLAYADQAKQQYVDFINSMGNVSPEELANKTLAAGYEIMVNTQDMLVIQSTKTVMAADSQTTICYKNIDLANNLLLTLPSLFKDDSYINNITANIKAQMAAQTAADPNKIYALSGPHSFENIDANQSFYINSEHQLVIQFNSFEVAAGYMGTPSFVIPTSVIASDLVSSAYIK